MITFDYNSFMIKKLNTKTKEKQCVNKSDISVFINDSELKIKIERLTKKAELKSEKDKIRQLETYDLSNFFSDVGFENICVCYSTFVTSEIKIDKTEYIIGCQIERFI